MIIKKKKKYYWVGRESSVSIADFKAGWKTFCCINRRFSLSPVRGLLEYPVSFCGASLNDLNINLALATSSLRLPPSFHEMLL